MKNLALGLIVSLGFVCHMVARDDATGYTHVPQRPFIDCKHWVNHKGIPVCVGDR